MLRLANPRQQLDQDQDQQHRLRLKPNDTLHLKEFGITVAK